MKRPTIILLSLCAVVWTLAETHTTELRAEPKPTKPSVSVRGHVISPKTVEIPRGASKIDILGAVAEAGGFKAIADKRKVVIILNYGKKDEEVVVVDIKNRKHEDDTYYHYVRAGDVIHVPQRRFD